MARTPSPSNASTDIPETPVAPHSDNSNPHAGGGGAGAIGALPIIQPRIAGGDPGIERGAGTPMAQIPTHSDRTRSAMRENSEKEASVPKPRQFRIVGNGGYFNDHIQGRQFLRAGKIVDARTYDIAALRAAGIPLAEVADADAVEQFFVTPPTADTPPTTS